MRLILVALSVLALLVVGALVGPSFVDWNQYKGQIVQQVEKATGLKMTIAGDIAIGILPAPHAKISDLTIEAARKKNFENLLTMKRAEVSVALGPLLSKKVEITSVELVEPVITLEKLADGTPSWQTDKLAKAKDVSEAASAEAKAQGAQAVNSALEAIAVRELEISDGTFAYVDHQSGAQYDAKEINVALEADSLNGPFEAEGSALYDGKKIALDIETGRLPKAGEELQLQAEMSLLEADASVEFGGVVSLSEPFEAQGQTNIDIGSLQKIAAQFDAQTGLTQSLKLDGLLTASQDKVDYNNLKLALDDFVGNGKISVSNLQKKDPLSLLVDLKSNTNLNLDELIQSAGGQASSQPSQNKGSSAKKQARLVPTSLMLPMPINAQMRFDLAGLTVQGQNLKGVFVDAKHSDKTIKVTGKVMTLPGQGRVDGAITVQYASRSQSAKTGQVTLSEPTISYLVNGEVAQLKPFLAAFAPKADTKTVTDLYQSADFNLKGAVTGQAIRLQDSVLKLDDFVIGLGGRYQPAAAGGRAKASIDVSAGSIDLDKIQKAQGKAPASNAEQGGAKPSKKDILKPLENFALPLDLTFDVSIQNLRTQGTDIKGVRASGDLIGNRLTLNNASVNDYAGAAMSVKGTVGNIQALTGLDLLASVQTQDIKRLASAFKVDTSKFPASLKAMNATVKGKGTLDAMSIEANLQAMRGALDVSGQVANLLETPSFDNLAVRLKHPNLVRAVQIVAPDFKGGAGLAQPVDFYTRVKSYGKTYTLSDIQTKLGGTDFAGNLTINTGAKPVSVRGDIQAGRIALDQLTGTTSKGSGSASSGGGKASPSSSGRWSKAPIDLGWMNYVDVDVDLSAASITHGKWNLTSPSTNLKIGNGQIFVNNVKAGLFGGAVNLTSTVHAQPVGFALNAQTTNIDLEKLVGALTAGNKLKSSGTVNFKADIVSEGANMHALVNALVGDASLDGKNVALKGFDLAKMARGLAVEEKLATSVTSLVDGATRGGETRFNTVTGQYDIKSGVANVTKMVMDGDAATIDTTGNANFPAWTVNLDNVITLKNVPNLKPFTVKIKGPLDNPTDTFGKNILEDYLTDKIKRKIGKELPDILGDDVTNKLQQFGILPQQQAPAPTPAPSNDNTAPAQPVAPQQPQQEAPKKIKKPEDALDTLLNSETPEDAVKDVLKGLF